MENKNYDIVFHLVGEEKVPNLLGVMQLQADKHVFIKSNDFSASYIKGMLNGAEYDEILVKPFEINDVINNLQAYIQKKSISDKKIAFNLTGGTKMMFTGAYLVCTDINADAYYFDTANRRMISLNDDTYTPIKHITKVKTFLDLGREYYFISSTGYTSLSDNRIKIAKKMMKYINDIKLLNSEYKKYTNSQGKLKFYNKYYGNIYVELYDNLNFNLKIDDIECSYKNIGFYKYINGGWFEDYVFSILKDYENQGKIYDLHSGMIMEDVRINKPLQEFDAIFTDGLKLFIIELKSGKKLDAIYINKIKQITNNFGGRYAQPVFISLEDNVGVENRALLDKVPYMHGRDFEKQLIKYLDKTLLNK